ncbi:primosomal replication protein N [Mannheimia varigena]|uniref:primosomal replication protein PriC n=1 Tax=Mannheimia varigena TaxID=85404 RepID=UPI00159E835F|nr:primosomal replication protein PriC [Mannheimia varigena]QLB16398.1 primosomal replication protein N [Mannheimia varigena]
MHNLLFITKIQQTLNELSPFSNRVVTIHSTYFTKKTSLVSAFIEEIKHTVDLLLKQDEIVYTEFYADKLIKQFEALSRAIEQPEIEKKAAQFSSSYQFSPNIHRLSPIKRLEEYRKALRALNEKISWLVEQNLDETDNIRKFELQNQIAETEYRKMNCAKAIEDLEQQLLLR